MKITKIETGIIELNLYSMGDASIPPCCGQPYPEGDNNEDCSVNLYDLEIVALSWLDNPCFGDILE